jgi:hypothetical protein
MKIPNLELRDVSEGIIQRVDSKILPPNSVYLSVNLLFDDYLGRAVLRKGSIQIGAQVVDDKSCLGLHNHITAAGSKVPLAVFNVTGDATATISKYTSNTWSNAKTGIAASAKTRFVTFLDTTMAVNGADTYSTADGSTWATSGGNLDIGNCPVGTVCQEFQDRVYVAGVSGNLDRLYFSGISDGSTISWTVGNGYIDIEPEEGAGAITALEKTPGYLLIFKERSLKRWDGSSTYPESLVDIGAPSQEAVVRGRQSIFYFNKRGIFETTGGYPRKTSRRIQDIIDAIPSTYYSSVSGGSDGDRVYFSIGDITVDNFAINNAVIAYSLDSQIWALLSFPTEIKRWSKYVDSNGDETVMAGDDDGNVWKILKGNQDGTTDISYMIQYQTQELGSRGKIKDISNTMFYVDNAKCQASCRINEAEDFKPMGVVKNNEQKLTKDLKGRYFEIRLQGFSRACQIIGWEFLEPNINDSYNE